MGPATVFAVESSGQVGVAISGHHARRGFATPAVSGYAPSVGDRVLVAEAFDGARYVIGVLGSADEDGAHERLLDPPASSPRPRSSIDGPAGAETISVRDAEDRLIFEHHVAEGRSVVYAEAGKVELRAPAGDLDVTTQGALRLRAGKGVEIEAPSVRVTTVPEGDDPASRLALGALGIEVQGRALDATVGRASLATGEARLVAQAIAITVETATQVAGIVELRAERIIERVKDAYREVEDLAQTRAGSLRLVVEDTFRLLGKRAFLKTEEDMKLKAERIHLG
jgi:hypothetical protein